MSEIIVANVFFSSDKQTGIIGGTPNTFSIIAGNTTSLIANSTSITLNNASFPTTVTVGNSSVNAVINSTSIVIGNSSINATVNSTSLIIGSNVSVNTSTLLIGNASVRSTVNSTVVTDQYDSVRSIPVNSQTTSYQLASSDNGRVVSSNAGITVNGAVIVANQAFTIFNNSAANITITQGAGATMYLSGTANTGNRTLAQRGLATIICYAANSFVITGTGVT